MLYSYIAVLGCTTTTKTLHINGKRQCFLYINCSVLPISNDLLPVFTKGLQRERCLPKTYARESLELLFHKTLLALSRILFILRPLEGGGGGFLRNEESIQVYTYIHFIHFICVVLNIHWGLFANTY